MSKQFREIEQIKVNSPCTLAWDNLSGNDDIRQCNKCNTKVYNFEKLTNRHKHSGECGIMR
jgi:hypothetical protein